jgi:hypothetical protein
MTNESQQQPAPPHERLAFSLCNDRDDRRTHGGPTMRVAMVSPDDSHEGLVHLDLQQLKYMYQQVQKALAQLNRAQQQFAGREQRLRTKRFTFEKFTGSRVGAPHDPTIDALPATYAGRERGYFVQYKGENLPTLKGNLAPSLEDAMDFADDHLAREKPAPDPTGEQNACEEHSDVDQSDATYEAMKRGHGPDGCAGIMKG